MHRPVCEELRKWQKKWKKPQNYDFEDTEAYTQLLRTLMGCKDLLDRASGWSKYTQIKLEQRNNKLVQVQKIPLVSH